MEQRSDTLFDEELRASFKSLADKLEASQIEKDWHPGSNGQVLDLVHPSLFPLVYGKSKVLAIGERVTTLQDCIDRAGEGSTVPEPEKPLPEAYGGRHWTRSSLEPYSTRFQWLPCEVDITQDKPKWVLPFLCSHTLIIYTHSGSSLISTIFIPPIIRLYTRPLRALSKLPSHCGR